MNAILLSTSAPTSANRVYLFALGVLLLLTILRTIRSVKFKGNTDKEKEKPWRYTINALTVVFSLLVVYSGYLLLVWWLG